MDIIALVKFSLDVRYADNDRDILPYIMRPKPQGLAQELWSSEASSWGLAPLDAKHSLALETIKILNEATAICQKEVALHDQHEKRIELIKGVENSEKVAGPAMGGYNQEVAEGWRDQGGELLFGQQF